MWGPRGNWLGNVSLASVEELLTQVLLKVLFLEPLLPCHATLQPLSIEELSMFCSRKGSRLPNLLEPSSSVLATPNFNLPSLAPK